jgi:hypothetical protein
MVGAARSNGEKEKQVVTLGRDLEQRCDAVGETVGKRGQVPDAQETDVDAAPG